MPLAANCTSPGYYCPTIYLSNVTQCLVDCVPCPTSSTLPVIVIVVSVSFLAAFYFMLMFSWRHHNNALFKVCSRHYRIVRSHTAFNFIFIKQALLLCTLYAASALPYPRTFRELLLGAFDGLLIPWQVDCLRQVVSWGFADTYIFRACCMCLFLYLVLIDLYLLTTPEQNIDPEFEIPGESRGGGLRRVSCSDRLSLASSESRRWFVNYNQGAPQGYDHGLYSAQYLLFTASNFFTYACMAFVAPQGGGEELFYDPSISGSRLVTYRAVSAVFIALYALACVWYFAIPAIAGLGDGESPWVPAPARAAGQWCRRNAMLKRSPPGGNEYHRAMRGYLYSSDGNIAQFKWTQMVVIVATAQIVQGPGRSVAVTAALLSLTVAELAAFSLQALWRQSWEPFALRGECAIYIAQLLLAVFTHAVAAACAAQGGSPDAPQWQPLGTALVLLHLLFFSAYAMYLARLVLFNHTCTHCSAPLAPNSYGSHALVLRAPGGGRNIRPPAGAQAPPPTIQK